MLGPDTPVHLKLLEIPRGREGGRGHRDRAVRLRVPAAGRHRHPRRRRGRRSTAPTSRCWSARGRARRAWSAPTCSRPTAAIFKPQGEAIAAGAADDIRVLVVGNPANTNALIAMSNADGVPRERFTAMTRLDHNRAVAQLAHEDRRRGVATSPTWRSGATTRRRCIPTCSTRRCGGERAWDVVGDEAWVADEFIPRVGKRGAEIIEARGASSRGVGGERGDRPRARLGAGHGRRRLGLDGGARPTAPTASRRGSSPRSRAARADGEWEIVEGLDVPEFSQRADRRARSTSSRGARRGEQLGLI